MNEKKYKRIFTVVIDSLGAGEMSDAASYGDAGTDTLVHVYCGNAAKRRRQGLSKSSADN